MHPRAAQLVATLGLAPHPEGGHFREVHRSTSHVEPADARRSRASLTVIYFLLTAGEMSCWHRVASDESWHFHEGDTLELLVAKPDFSSFAHYRLGATAPATVAVHVVPAAAWQAARTTGAYTLVSCSVGPGFDFEDFEMLRDRPDVAADVRRNHPDISGLI
jgi:predicted cupin superfamily sugar epimerase